MHRDTYFFDICAEAGLDPSDPHDWVNIGLMFASDPDLEDAQ